MNPIYKRTIFSPRFWVLGYQRIKIWDGSEFVDHYLLEFGPGTWVPKMSVPNFGFSDSM